MSGFPILDLVIGIIFIYFLLSIISSSFVEIILSFFEIRGKVLAKWMTTIFDKKIDQSDGTPIQLGTAIINHCITTALSKKGKATAFIDAKNFVSALIEKITFDPANPTTVVRTIDDIADHLQNRKAADGTPIVSRELQRTILLFIYEARAAYQAIPIEKKTESELALFREKLENWFDTSMDRVTGALKTRYTRPITFWVGLIIVVLLNADSVALSKYLYNNPDSRSKIAAQAVVAATDTTWQKEVRQLAEKDSVKSQQYINDIKEKKQLVQRGITTLHDDIPLGWDADINKIISQINATKVVGLLMTVLAIMLGAPFWFDLLNKIANIRGSGTKPESTIDKSSKAK